MAAANGSTPFPQVNSMLLDVHTPLDPGVAIRQVEDEENGGTLPEAAAVCAGSKPALTPEQRIAQLEGALNTAPVGLATLDLEFRYTHVNQMFARLYGKSVEAFVGRTVSEVLPRWAPQIHKHLGDALRLDGIVECEISLNSPVSGEPLVYLRTCRPVRDASGGVTGLSVGLIDITERKRAEARLQESEDNYRHAIELNPHIPWTFGGDGELFEISSRWTTLTGQKSGRISLMDWARAPHPEDVPAVAEAWERSKASGEPLDVEYRVRCADGRMRWIRARASALRDAEGKIVRWYGMNEDIDHRKQMDAALEEEKRRLERATEQLAMLVREDHLTGLANRRHFDDTLEREVHLSSRSGFPMALVMMDVDRFKSYNDTYGHVAGDACLRHIGAALRQVVRQPVDLVARYGGEEFAIVLPNTTEQQAMEVACRAIEQVRSLGLPHSGSSAQRVTLSAGIAMLGRTEARVGDAAVVSSHLVQMADLALYAAKKGGRDRVVGGRSLAMLACSLGDAEGKMPEAPPAQAGGTTATDRQQGKELR